MLLWGRNDPSAVFHAFAVSRIGLSFSKQVIRGCLGTVFHFHLFCLRAIAWTVVLELGQSTYFSCFVLPTL